MALYCTQVPKLLCSTSCLLLTGVNLVAFIIIVFSYGSMFYSVHQTTITAMEIRNHVKKEMTLAKRFFFIVFTDALCWIPIFILKLLSLLQVEIPGKADFLRILIEGDPTRRFYNVLSSTPEVSLFRALV